MDARLLVSSKFMVSETFGLGDVPKEPLVTIAKVALEEQEGDKGKERWGLLYFKEPWARPLKVNRTHQRALIEMFGPETDQWLGKRIGLYAMAGTFFGKRQTAVRIRGSPDLKAPVSFQVKKFGGGKDTYDLVPMGVGKPAKEPPPDPSVQVIYSKHPLYRRVLTELTVDELNSVLAANAEALKSNALNTDQVRVLEVSKSAIEAAIFGKGAAEPGAGG